MSDRAEATSAVIIRTTPLRESDLVVAVLTPQQGKVPCIARGARRSKKRFAGGLPIGAIGEKLGVPGDALLPYGHTKAKLSHDYVASLADRPDGKLVQSEEITVGGPPNRS